MTGSYEQIYNNMNLLDLAQSLAPLVAQLHPLTETNVEAVTQEGGKVVLWFDASELESQLEDAKGEAAQSATDCNAAEEEADKANARADALEALLDEVKDESEPGLTLREARGQCADWKKIASDNKRICEEARAELTALRKRKGVTVALFANERAVLSLLGRVVEYPKDADRHVAEANELLAKLHA